MSNFSENLKFTKKCISVLKGDLPFLNISAGNLPSARKIEIGNNLGLIAGNKEGKICLMRLVEA